MSDKGEYRAIYTALVDDPAFQALSPNAKLVFLLVKLQLGPSGIGVLYSAVLAEQSGIPLEGVADGMRELAAGGAHAWLRVERNVVWIRNGLKFEPNLTITNRNHRLSVEAHLRSLPKLPIVNDFAAYYGLGPAFDPPSDGGWDNPSHRRGIPDQGDGEGKGEGEGYGDYKPTVVVRDPARENTRGDGGDGVIDLADHRRPAPPPPVPLDPALAMMPWVKRHLRLGQPYPGRSPDDRRREEARDLDVLRELLSGGTPPETIADALRGAVLLRDRGTLQMRGWVKVGEPMTCRILKKRNNSGPCFWEEALGAYRRSLDDDEDDTRSAGGLQPVVVEIAGRVA